MGSKQPLRRFVGEGLPRFFSFLDPTHMEASDTGSAFFLSVHSSTNSLLRYNNDDDASTIHVARDGGTSGI